MPAPVQTLSALRVAVGAGAWLTPGLTGKAFGIHPDNNAQGDYLARLFGVRDVALAAGTTASSGASRRQWLQAGIACDALDTVAAVIAGRNGSLAKPYAILAGGVAAAATVMGIAALASEPS